MAWHRCASGELENGRESAWCSLWECAAARRIVSNALRRNTGDSQLVAGLLETLRALERWRTTILEELGLPESVIRDINSFISLLEGGDFPALTPAQSRNLLNNPACWVVSKER